MTRYLISFDHGAMDHIADEEGPAVRDASLAVIRDAKAAGVCVFAEGVYPGDEVSAKVVAPDGTVTEGAEITSPESRLSTFPHSMKHWSGPPSSPTLSAVRKRFASSRRSLSWATDRAQAVVAWASDAYA
jgi:hypothetical protein